MSIRAVFFDLDDTLHDHLYPFSNSIQSSFPELYHQVQMNLLYKKFRYYSDILWKDYSVNQLTLEDLRIKRIMEAFKFFKFVITTDQAIEFQKQYEHTSNQLQLFSEVPSLLQTLMSKGYLVGIITNGPVEHQFNKMASLNLIKHIPRHLIFISDEVGIAKPNPQLFQFVAGKTGYSSSEHVYIGDTWENDIAAASDAGWQSIWYNHRNRKAETNHKPLAELKRLSIDNLLNVLECPKSN